MVHLVAVDRLGSRDADGETVHTGGQFAERGVVRLGLGAGASTGTGQVGGRNLADDVIRAEWRPGTVPPRSDRLSVAEVPDAGRRVVQAER